ncbi:hypothetical protein TSUD_318810 [Trifolium subterraneum]|uniref:C3H1-type domain-containing protein n=1 Tax=Trifolium subterraneum TaxID=3900 RepID=A0A2Z6P6T7_TRISU|nr:hypothetical protein TSUD_318810 [Trifolium subterraneum]
MSGTGRKRSSKWDLSDEHKQMRSGWSSADVAGNNSSKWAYSEGNDKLRPVMGYSSKESFSGGRGSYEDDAMNEDHRISDTRREWDTDGSYSKKMSSWQEEWEQKRHSQSPINGWNRSSRSRSQSRSPPRGFRRDSGVDDRKRMRVVGSTRPCRDFAAGKCRRGSLCNFLHHDNQSRENSWEGKHREDRAPRYSATHERGDHSLKSGRSNEACINFAKGSCRMGASCKFMHDNDSDGYGKVSMDEFTREREDRAPRYPATHEGGDHSLKRGRSNETCTNFAKGRCRMGTSCKFVHDNDSDGYGKDFMDEFPREREIDRRHRDNSFEQGGRQACRSPNRRLRDDRWARNPGRDHQMLDRQKLSDSISPNRRLRDDRWGSDGDVADPDRVGDSPKRNNTVSVSDTAKLIENKIVTTDIWPGDAEMSPDWNYKTGSSSHVEEPGQNKHGIRQGGTYLPISEPDRVQLAPGQSINQNAQNVNPLHTSSCHAVGQSQLDVPILPSSGGIVDAMHRQEVSNEKKYIVEPNITDSGLSQVSSINPPTQNAVSNEQLAQLTTSLAHILGAGQQLPQLYAALNSHDLKDSPSQGKTQAPAMPVSITCIKPDPAVGLPKQYGPVNDSIEQTNADASGVSPAIPPSKNIAEVEILSQLSNPGRQNCGDSIKGASSELVKTDNLIHLQPGQNTVVNKDNNEEVAKERKHSEDGHKSTKENGPQNTDQNGRPDDAKQTKEMKGIRTFKFALAEVVKELLKPAWKEGQITNKEDYKTIVKKVLDKVTATMQGPNIPQTQEKIDQYLSFSKPKLNKLVQAYVEKVQKPQ